jgi:hypothetical protein
MKQLRTLVSLGAIGLALSVSCGGSDTKGNGGGGGSGGGANGNYNHDAECNRVSADEVSAALGVEFTGPTVNSVSTSSTTALCDYDSSASMTYASIGYYPGVSRSTFDLGRKNTDDAYSGWDTEDATGIGDVAYSYSNSDTIHTVVFLKGSTQVLVSANSTATMDQVKQLAVLVAGKL